MSRGLDKKGEKGQFRNKFSNFSIKTYVVTPH